MLVGAITCNGFELESPNLLQIYILGFFQLVLKMGVIDIDFQGHLAIATHETAFNVALIFWSRPAKGCYTSQARPCLHGFTIVPFHKDFPPSGEQPEHRKLAHEL